MIRMPIMLLIALTELSGGCVSIVSARGVQPSCVFGEYSFFLQTGQEEGELGHYNNLRVNGLAGKKIMLKPVIIWEGFSTKLGFQQRRELYRLAGFFEDMLYMKLSKNNEMVEEPTAGAMLIQVVITGVETFWSEPVSLSKPFSQLQAVGTIWTIGGDEPAFVGRITAGFMLHNAPMGNRFAEGADQCVGDRKPFDSEAFSSYGDIKSNLEFWTDPSAYRLCVLRGETNCSEPMV